MNELPTSVKLAYEYYPELCSLPVKLYQRGYLNRPAIFLCCLFALENRRPIKIKEILYLKEWSII